MKYLKLILSAAILIFLNFQIGSAAISLDWLWADSISDTSIQVSTDNDIVTSINNTGFQVLTIAKAILEWALLIYIVYIWVQMVMSLWTNEESLSSSKRQIWYAIIGFIFVNIPASLYNAFSKNNYGTLNGRSSYSSWFKTPWNNDSNVFIDIFDFGQTLNGDIIWFLEVAIWAMAIFMIVLTGLQVIGARGREEVLTEAKNKVSWSIVWLIFIGFIEAWKNFVFGGKIDDGVNIFETLSSLLLFLAWPIAIVFLTLAGYYYITSNGDDEKITKAKNIITNTVIATVILLASYTFLLDLAKL